MKKKGCRSEITLISVIVLLSYRLFRSEDGKGTGISFPLSITSSLPRLISFAVLRRQTSSRL